MPINLKRTGIKFDATYRNDTNDNWTAIENAVAGVEGVVSNADGLAQQALTKADGSFVTSTEALSIANTADEKAEATQTQLNNIVIESGTSDAETIQARGGEDLLYQRLDKTDQRLAENVEDIRITQSNPINYNGGMVTFVDDDAHKVFENNWRILLSEFPDVKISIAVVKDWVENSGTTYLSLDELKTLQTQGHDILCHTAHHEASYLITPERADLDYPVAVQWMKDNGLKGYEHLVYPGGLSPNSINIKDVARKHFKYAISTEVAGDYAPTPVDNWCVPRINGDAKTIDELKVAVDYAKANNVWLVVMTHAHQLNLQGDAGTNKMREFIQYIKTQNLPILPYSEAIKYKGNAVALGEYTSPKGKFVSVNGDSKGFIDANTPIQTLGTWLPKLEGSTVAGNHTYAIQQGNYIRTGRQVTVEFSIRIEFANLDNAMSGNLRISGLPFTDQTGLSAQSLTYNIFNLGVGYTNVFANTTSTTKYLTLLKTGNNVTSAFVNKTEIPLNNVVVIGGQITYTTAD